MDSECKSRDVLQSYFDLLGELMKFNVDAFKRFNKYINTDAKVRLGPESPKCLLWHHLSMGLGLPTFRCGHTVGRVWVWRAVFSKHSVYTYSVSGSRQTTGMRTLVVTAVQQASRRSVCPVYRGHCLSWALTSSPYQCAPSLLQFQVFLKQINSSLVDSNMLVRCVTLSLDRFENQVDMKGKEARVPW